MQSKRLKNMLPIIPLKKGQKDWIRQFRKVAEVRSALSDVITLSKEGVDFMTVRSGFLGITRSIPMREVIGKPCACIWNPALLGPR